MLIDELEIINDSTTTDMKTRKSSMKRVQDKSTDKTDRIITNHMPVPILPQTKELEQAVKEQKAFIK